MQIPPIPSNETQRLATLRALQILDTPPEERFDRITRLAQSFFDVPIVALSLIDDKRQWFKSSLGLSVCETSRDISFCAHAMLSHELLIIPDTLTDARFADNPVVTGKPCIRFYAGYPLHALDGSALGSLCIIDSQPRELSVSDQQALRDLGAWAENEINGMTERTAMLERLQHQAKHDALTNLPNRTFLEEQIEAALLAAVDWEGSTVLLMLDLDRFKEVNDTFGHHQGDQLLLQVSTRLHDALATLSVPGTVARLGGDEFAVLLPMVGEEKVHVVVQAIRRAFEEPFTIAEMPVQIDVSIGVVSAPTDGKDVQTLLRRVDIAMYAAKRTHTGYAFYDPGSDESSPYRLAIIGALRQAIASNALQLYYQPKADVKTGAVCSVEALARWYHSTYGFIPPDQFIPLAEQMGLIAPLTLWVLETALRQCRAWRNAGHEITIAVNLSMWNLRDVTLPDTIGMLLQSYELPASLLCVELTEGTMMTDIHRTLEVLNRLVALGVRISMDDFGTGYSSLAYLKRLPIDELKIDRSFVQHMATNEADATIVRSTVALAHHLGLHVVAEGVEDQVTWDNLAAFDCDVIQGYYLSRPVPAAEFERWLQARDASSQHASALSLV